MRGGGSQALTSRSIRAQVRVAFWLRRDSVRFQRTEMWWRKELRRHQSRCVAMTAEHGGSCTAQAANASRRNIRVNTLLPDRSAAHTAMTSFARSTPTVVISFMTSPLIQIDANHFNLGTSMPCGSTASSRGSPFYSLNPDAWPMAHYSMSNVWRSLMKPGSLPRWLSRLGVAALLMAGAAPAANVHVMISAGFYGVYSELGPAFERASGHHLVTTRGPSMGDSPEAIPTRLARGETADVVILDGGAADELGRRGLVRADSKVELARSLIGMVVRAGAAKPDIRSVEAFRSTLLAAKSIAYSDSGSGTYLSTTLFPKLGVADQVSGKSLKVRGPPSGEPVAAVVARGEVEIGFQQVSELIHVPGITFVGTIPAELQPVIFFAAALTSTAQQPEAASALVRFLASPEAAPPILKAGLTPLSAR
jgi:molybdate transport system substrate-binding protein